MFDWIKHNRFPLILSLGLVVMEMAIAGLLFASAGPNRVWLGDTIQSPSDQAVYLGDIEQIKSGALGLVNFYAPLPQALFWHPVYVMLGFLARLTGWSAIFTHEFGRWLATIIAIFLLHGVSRRLTKNERDAAWATGLVALGGGLGWVWAVAGHVITFGPGNVIPDLTSETFFFPTLLMGAHVILAFGLFPYSLQRIWRAIVSSENIRWSWLAPCILIFIHPYVIPVMGLVGLAAIGSAWRKTRRIPWRTAIPFLIGGLIALAPHVWTELANPSRRFLLLQNDLSLGSPVVWLFAFGPWLGLLAWRWHRRIALKEEERWLIAWVAAAALALLLPFAWKRKIAEGLGAAVLWLCLPIVFRIRDALHRLGRLQLAACSVLVCLSPLMLLRSQVAWAGSGIGRGDELFVTRDVMQSWTWIRGHTPQDTTVLTDDAWIGTWTPTYAQRHVWIGHEQETPDWQKRLDALRVLDTGNLDEIRGALPLDSDLLLVTKPTNISRFSAMLGAPVVRFGDVAVWYTPKP